jgi:hypothetical protein
MGNENLLFADGRNKVNQARNVRQNSERLYLGFSLLR